MNEPTVCRLDTVQRPMRRCPWGVLLALPVIAFGFSLLVLLLAPLTEVFSWLIFLLVVAGSLLLGATGLAWAFAALLTRRRHQLPWAILAAGAAVWPAIYVSEGIFSAEQGSNEARGTMIAHAVEKFHADTGSYPATLNDLRPKYLATVPRCWYGVVQYDFAYSDAAPEPFLKYMDLYHPGFCGHFYYFSQGKWKEDCL